MKTMKLATKIFLAVIGVLLVAAGIVCLADPIGAVSTVAWVVGLVLLISGITTAIYYFVFGSFLVFAFPVLLNAILHIVFGVVFLQHPDGTSRVFLRRGGRLRGPSLRGEQSGLHRRPHRRTDRGRPRDRDPDV